MNQEKMFSDEFLNAFVDNQITAEEKSQAFVEIGKDEAVNRQVCELRQLHDLVQLAYRDLPEPPARHTPGSPSRRLARFRFGVAASILLVLGVVLGSQFHLPVSEATRHQAVTHKPATHKLHEMLHARHNAALPAANTSERTANSVVADRSPVQSVTSLPAGTAAAIPAPATPRAGLSDKAQNKVLIHLARDDNDQLAQALDDIEGMLRYYRDARINARVEVVVNGGGMALVRSDTSAFAARIQRLQREYTNVTFAACQNTIDRLAREHGITVRLLPGVITIDSGMAEIMRRQNQGWTYLQV